MTLITLFDLGYFEKVKEPGSWCLFQLNRVEYLSKGLNLLVINIINRMIHLHAARMFEDTFLTKSCVLKCF